MLDKDEEEQCFDVDARRSLTCGWCCWMWMAVSGCDDAHPRRRPGRAHGALPNVLAVRGGLMVESLGLGSSWRRICWTLCLRKAAFALLFASDSVVCEWWITRVEMSGHVVGGCCVAKSNARACLLGTVCTRNVIDFGWGRLDRTRSRWPSTLWTSASWSLKSRSTPLLAYALLRRCPVLTRACCYQVAISILRLLEHEKAVTLPPPRIRQNPRLCSLAFALTHSTPVLAKSTQTKTRKLCRR